MLRQALRGVLRLLMRKVVLRAIAVPVRRRLARFEAATLDPKRVQEAVLRDILTHQAETAFGRDHGFRSCRTVEDYRRQVSVAGYEAIEPYIERVRKGETNALLADPKIYMFALTSGTTATRKFIPVTGRYLADYKNSWNLWGLKVFTDHHELLLRPIVQLAGDADEFRTETGIPCGAVTGLTATMQKRIVRRHYCIPPELARVTDPRAKYYSVLRLALPKPVALWVAANPSTMINLARALDQHKEALIRDVHDGTLDARLGLAPEVRQAVEARLRPAPERARELEEVVRRTGQLYPRDAWTKPFLLGNWTGGSMGAYLRHYPRYFGDNWVRDPGLIASEGRMTIPFADGTPAGVLDVTSHYFEFLPEGEVNSPRPTVLGAHELSEGGRYFILLTTGYGLYRYHIHDLVRVAGFFNGTPLIEFLSKGSYFSSVTGEKLSEYHVTRAMASLLGEMGLAVGGYTVAPCWQEDDQTPYYGLFLEQPDAGPAAVQLARRLDEELCRLNVEYESKRASGRLGQLRLESLPVGFWARWDRARLERSGGGAGAVQAAVPDRRPGVSPRGARGGGAAVGGAACKLPVHTVKPTKQPVAPRTGSDRIFPSPQPLVFSKASAKNRASGSRGVGFAKVNGVVDKPTIAFYGSMEFAGTGPSRRESSDAARGRQPAAGRPSLASNGRSSKAQEPTMIVESQTPAPQPQAPPAELLAVEPIGRPALAQLTRPAPVRVPVNWYVACKRILDVALALAMLVIAAPLILLCALLVKLTSRGPAFYSQVRAGRGGKPFTIWKLRSMYHNCEQFSGIVWSKKGDSRVTPIGAILRRTHLDELPQLWNVLVGDMSLVGPRPERPEFVPQLDKAVPRYRERMLVLPGVTGLAQIHQGADTDLASVERKLAYDLYYVKTLSFATDLKILLATALHVVWPLSAGKLFFRLTAHGCAEAVGTRIRESVN